MRGIVLFAVLFCWLISFASAADISIRRPSCKELVPLSIAMLSPMDAKRCHRKPEPTTVKDEPEWQLMVKQDMGSPRPYKAPFHASEAEAMKAIEACNIETHRECFARSVKP